MGSQPSSYSSDENEEFDDSMGGGDESIDVDDYYSDHIDTEDEEDSDPDNDINHYNIENSVESVIIPTSAVDLKEMASLSVAISLWNHSNIPRCIHEFSGGMFSDLERAIFDKVFESRTQLPVPISISEHIGKFVIKMRSEIRKWIEYHYQHVFFNHKNDRSVYYYIYYIVWYCNGTINYKESARSLMNCPRLNEVEKYHLLCTYCLKDDIERMPASSLSRLLSNNVVELVNFSNRPLIFYWNCYFRNEMENVTMLSMISGASVDCYMIKHRLVDNWPAKEYFFDRLSSDEQVQTAIWLIDSYGIKYLKVIMMKLNESQHLHVYMDRSVKIMTLYSQTGVNHEDILATWSEIRNLINSNQFVVIFKKMLTSSNAVILKDIWTSASDEFKRYVLNSSQLNEIVENALRLWVDDKEHDLFFTMIQEADANLIEILSKKQYFLDVCEKLITGDKLKLLDRLLNSCFGDAQDLAVFKRNLIDEDFFVKECVRLIMDDELPKLERLLDAIFLDPNESTVFKRNLTKKESFLARFKTAIMRNELSAVERLLNVCFPSIEESTKFIQDFTKEDFFTEHCQDLIINDLSSVLEQFLHVFLPQAADLSRFKLKLAAMEFFTKHCEDLMRKNHLITLSELLNSILLNAEEIQKFKRDLFLNSNAVRSRCLNYFFSGNFERIDELLIYFLTPYPELIPEYKKNLIQSPEALSRSIEFFATRPEVLNKISVEGNVPDDVIVTLKRNVIFSNSVTPIMQSWIREGRINLLEERLNQFLTTDADKRALKEQVLRNPLEFVYDFFFKNDNPAWQSLMLWRFESESAVHEYKVKMPVDEIFDDILKKCVFETYDAANLRNCKFKSQTRFELKPLDRFLTWYFQTPNLVKEYKLKRIDLYTGIETIRMLLKKTKPMYLKEIITWIFEKDHAEIYKFKTKNKGRKILKYFDD